MDCSRYLSAGLVATFLSLCWVEEVTAQPCSGSIPAGTICGNPDASRLLPRALPLRKYLTEPSSITLNVNHSTGTDNVDCGAIGTPCRTIYYAARLFQSSRKTGMDGVATIQSDCGFTETPPGAFLGAASTGHGLIFILGNPSSPKDCTWNSEGIVVDDGMVISLRGFRTATISSGKTWLTVAKLGLVVYADMVWGPNVGGAHIVIGIGASAVAENPLSKYQVGDAVGGCAPVCFNYHVINNGGAWELLGRDGISGVAIEVPQPLTFTAFYSAGVSAAVTNVGTNIFSGGGLGTLSTGKPYELYNSASANFSGTQLPGNAFPTVSANACHNLICAGVTSLFGGSPAALVQGTTNFCGPAACGTGGSGIEFRLPDNGTFKNLQVTSSVAPVAGQTYIVTVFAGGDTAVTCTISNPNTTCSDLVHSTGVLLASQSVFVKIALSATAGNATFSFGLRLESAPQIP